MKINELNELRKKGVDELVKIVADKKKKLATVRIQTRAGREKNLKVGRNISREIAKILTLIRESQILEKEAGKKLHKEDRN